MQTCVRFILCLGVRDSWKQIYSFCIIVSILWMEGQQPLCQLNWYNGTFVMEANIQCVALHLPTTTQLQESQWIVLIPLPLQPRVFPLLQKCPWRIHMLSRICLALGQQLFLWTGLRLEADLHGWGLYWQLASLVSCVRYHFGTKLALQVPSLNRLKSNLSIS